MNKLKPMNIKKSLTNLAYKKGISEGREIALRKVADGKTVKPFRCPLCDKITTLTCVECAEKEFTQEEKAKWKKKIEDLDKFVSQINNFHWDEIQKILGEKELGKIDINLDVLYKIHNNGHGDCVKIIRKMKELLGNAEANSQEKKE